MDSTNRCLIFAALAVCTNWRYSVQFSGAHGVASWSIELLGWTVLLAVIAIPVLLFRCYKLVRIGPAPGREIPRDAKIIFWRPCLLLFPLLFNFGRQGGGATRDGSTYTTQFSYGSNGSLLALLSCTILIVLYQIYAAFKNAAGPDAELSEYALLRRRLLKIKP